MKVYAALEAENALYRTTKNFLNNTMNMNIKLKFDIDDWNCDPLTICTGYTDPSGQNEITIYIHEDYLSQASSISVARTLLHESIHAHLGYYVKIINNRDDISIDDFPGILAYYKNNELNEWQHNQIADYYRDIIISGMRSFSQDHSNYFYESMSWAGLSETEAWSNLTDQNKEGILDIIRTEANKGGCK